MNSFALRFAGTFLIIVAISSSRASAWWPSPQAATDAPPKTGPADTPKADALQKQEPKAAKKSKLDSASKAADKPKPAVKPKGGTRTRGLTDAQRRAAKKKRQAKRQFEMNPNAKWACDQKTVALEPVWRGEKTLTFAFSIRNEGTADLRIRAKGG